MYAYTHSAHLSVKTLLKTAVKNTHESVDKSLRYYQLFALIYVERSACFGFCGIFLGLGGGGGGGCRGI